MNKSTVEKPAQKSTRRKCVCSLCGGDFSSQAPDRGYADHCLSCRHDSPMRGCNQHPAICGERIRLTLPDGTQETITRPYVKPKPIQEGRAPFSDENP